METWQRCNTTPVNQLIYNIPNLIEDRIYEFRVFAVNDAGLSPEAWNQEPYTFKPAGGAKAPEILTPLRDTAGEEGRQVRLECHISGNPRPTIKWFKGARELIDTTKFSMVTTGDRHELVINELYGEDADEYTCRATNSGGAKSTRAEVFIKSKPRVYVPPRYHNRLETQKGEQVVMKIPFRGYPHPVATWTRDGVPVQPDGADIVMETMDRYAILTLKNLKREDSGAYQLRVTNDLGFDSCTIHLLVCDMPEPPRFPVVENVLEEAIILSWKPPLFDGGSFITSYVVEKRELPGGEWTPVTKTRFTYQTIEGLKPSHVYEFRVRAENKHGASVPCEPTTPITMKGKDDKRRRGYEVDETGKKIRGKADGPVDNYDNYVFDIWKQYHPQEVSVKSSSVYNQYEILEEIGEGAFGVVHRCRERATGNIFAAKFINTPHAIDKQTVRGEIAVMNQLRDQKLIHLHDAFEDESEMVLVYEFMSGGELFEKVAEDSNRMSETDAINYVRQLCQGLKVMHEKNIAHLDVKPENLMFTTKRANELKLIDFGLAAKLDPRETVKVSTGTAEFAAPEIVTQGNIGFYTDMWSVGVLSYVLLSGLSPFAGSSDQETLRNVRAGDWDFDSGSFSSISDEAKDFIKKLIMKDPDGRMSAHEALEHPWLSGGVSRDTDGRLDSGRYSKIRDGVRARYESWPEPNPALGRIANYSALRKLRPAEYSLHDVMWDRREAQPRFAIRPYSVTAAEGASAQFHARVIAGSPPIVSWSRDGRELKQSVKYMKRYDGDDYALTINRVRLEDRGEYVVRAKNSYGTKEELVFLDVRPAGTTHFSLLSLLLSSRRVRHSKRKVMLAVAISEAGLV